MQTGKTTSIRDADGTMRLGLWLVLLIHTLVFCLYQQGYSGYFSILLVFVAVGMISTTIGIRLQRPWAWALVVLLILFNTGVTVQNAIDDEIKGFLQAAFYTGCLALSWGLVILSARSCCVDKKHIILIPVSLALVGIILYAKGTFCPSYACVLLDHEVSWFERAYLFSGLEGGPTLLLMWACYASGVIVHKLLPLSPSNKTQ